MKSNVIVDTLDEFVTASGAVDRGIEDGIHNLPPAEAIAPAESEGAIRQWFQAQGTAIIGDLRQKLARPLEEATALVPVVTGEAILKMPEMVDKRMEDIVRSEEITLAPIAANASETGRAAKGVVIAVRGAMPEDAFAWRRDVILLAGTVLVETSFNGWTFAVGSSNGWLGGMAQAMSISMVNVSGAWSLGRVARAIDGFDTPTAKYTSRGVLMLGAAALSAYHLTVAAFRDLLLHSTHQEQAGQIVFKFLADHGPGGITDLASWMLAAIGLGFAGWATLSGWRHVDIRARAAAGKVLRAAARARAIWDGKKATLFGSVSIIHGEAQEHIVVLAANARDALARLHALVMMMKADTNDLNTQLMRLNEAYVLAIAKYRTTNSRVRAAIAPRHFAEAPEPLAFVPSLDEKISVLAEIAGDGVTSFSPITQNATTAEKAIDQARPDHIAAVQALINRIERQAAGNEALREIHAPVISLPRTQLRPS